MTPPQSAWYSVGAPGETRLRCAACRREFDLGYVSADHHPSVCPLCGVESLFFGWKDRPAQLLPDRAPGPLASAVRWAQDRLDELDFVELLCALEELGAALEVPTRAGAGQSPPLAG